MTVGALLCNATKYDAAKIGNACCSCSEHVRRVCVRELAEANLYASLLCTRYASKLLAVKTICCFPSIEVNLQAVCQHD